MDSNKKEKIIILGAAHPFRGGIASFNERLACEFQKEGHEVVLYTFTLQYPAFLFPGKTQYSSEPPPENLTIKRAINSVNPFNWRKVGRKIRAEKPDLVIFAYWMPFMAPCLGTIARAVKKDKKVKCISLVHNMIPHEKHFYDAALTRYFIKPIDAYIAMSKSVYDDIERFDPKKPKTLSPHPLYDHFGEKISRQEALNRLSFNENNIYFLFFGFIRAYKGLDLLIEAFADERLRKFPVKLIVAGEFYENEKPYLDAIQKNNLSNDVILRTDFIPNEEVKTYFCAADLIVQPYKNATQSGVTQIGYHFEKPMLVTDVGGLAEIIPHGKAGYVVAPDSRAIADALVDFLENKPDFSQGIREEKEKYGWDKLVAAIKSLTETSSDNSARIL
jgi:glycosyltransferase involved in cell wall biosynthesis